VSRVEPSTMGDCVRSDATKFHTVRRCDDAAVALVGFGSMSGGFVWDVARLATFYGLNYFSVTALLASMASLGRLLFVGDGVSAWITRSGWRQRLRQGLVSRWV
jgi:hypothetical protein